MFDKAHMCSVCFMKHGSKPSMHELAIHLLNCKRTNATEAPGAPKQSQQ